MSFSKSLGTLRRWLAHWKVGLKKNNQTEIWEKKGRKLLGERWREEVNILCGM